jgi:hypothetical protein
MLCILERQNAVCLSWTVYAFLYAQQPSPKEESICICITYGAGRCPRHCAASSTLGGRWRPRRAPRSVRPQPRARLLGLDGQRHQRAAAPEAQAASTGDSLVGAGGAASTGDDLVCAVPCRAVRVAPCRVVRAAPSRVTMNRRPRLCCAKPRCRGWAVLRQAPRRRPGTEPPVGQQARAHMKLLLPPTTCSCSLPIAPSRGIEDLLCEYAVCPASCSRHRLSARIDRLAAFHRWFHGLFSTRARGLADVLFISLPAPAAQDGGRRRRLANEGNGVEQGRARATTRATAPSRRANLPPMREESQFWLSSLLKGILHRCFASPVGEEFENALWRQRCIFAFALFCWSQSNLQQHA